MVKGPGLVTVHRFEVQGFDNGGQQQAERLMCVAVPALQGAKMQISKRVCSCHFSIKSFL
jgi:hypothetical protein